MRPGRCVRSGQSVSAADAGGLGARYQDALRLGAELLQILHSPAQHLDRITELIALREAEAAGAQALINQGADPAPYREILQALLAQQEQLQAALQAGITAIQARHAAGQAQQQKLQDVRRLLNVGARSRHLNECR